MKWAPVLLLVTMGSSGGPGQAQATRKATQHEQCDFGAEDENWERPVPVPYDVLQTLRKINQASPDELPADSLLASEIHLNGPHEIDLILMGIKGLRLPHAALFWIFQKTARGHELILSTGGDSLTVLRTRSNGYCNIRTYNNTANTTTATIYKFDGHQYREYKSPPKPIQ